MDQIELGTAPWTEAWKPGEKALPRNIKTGRQYRGCNSVWLASNASSRGFADERWGTFRQVRDIGGHVRRGEKGCPILFWQFEARRLARDKQGRPVVDQKGQPVYESRALRSPRVYRYTVFNAEQCGGLPARVRRDEQAWTVHERAEQVLKEAGAAVEHSAENRAFYDLARDRIVLPFRDQFQSGAGYYQTALHELGHWTGHPSRLNRSTLIKGVEYGDDSKEYAREELRAEISSMITGDRIGLGHDPSRHASYVGSWVRALRDDPREIYRASRDAQEMSDFVLGRDRDRAETREEHRGGRSASPPERTVIQRPEEASQMREPPRRPAVTIPPPGRLRDRSRVPAYER